MAGYDFSARKAAEEKGSGDYSIFDFSTLKTKPNYFKLAIGTNKFDVLPYFPTSTKHPLIAKGKLKKGAPDYNLAIYVHKRVGAGNGNYVCPDWNYGQPCPICEAKERLKESGETDKDTLSAYNPSMRLFYNVVDTVDREKGVQIFESNNKYFQTPLVAAQTDVDGDEDMQEASPGAFFANPDNGLTIKVLGVEKSFNNNKYTEPSSITLVKRKESVSEFMDDVIEFDKYVKVLSYDELEAIFTGAVTEEEEEAPPAKPAKKAAVEEEETPKSRKVCPSGYKWSTDNDAKPECEDCKLWRNCAKDTEPN